MKSNKLSLRVLEAYAKTLTKSQVKRLYEAKTSKQYNKALFEAVGYNNEKTPYEFWIDNYVINEYGLPDPYDIKDEIIQEFGDTLIEEIYVTDDGLAIRTADPDTYEQILEVIQDLYPEIPNEIINNNIDPRYLSEN